MSDLFPQYDIYIFDQPMLDLLIKDQDVEQRLMWKRYLTGSTTIVKSDTVILRIWKETGSGEES